MNDGDAAGRSTSGKAGAGVRKKAKIERKDSEDDVNGDDANSDIDANDNKGVETEVEANVKIQKKNHSLLAILSSMMACLEMGSVMGMTTRMWVESGSDAETQRRWEREARRVTE